MDSVPARAPRVSQRGSRGQSRRKGEGGRTGAKAKQFTFEIFFPQPGPGSTPYFGAHYRAARGKDGLYNFVGLVLGHGGATVQRIQKASGAKIELRDSSGNLNGAHPGSHSDPSLHAWVAAASRQRLDKAVTLLLEVLQPSNTRLHAVDIAPGASVHLHPIIPSDWPEAAEAAVAAVAQAAAHTQAVALAQPSAAAAPAPSSIWASTGCMGSCFQLPPVGSPTGLDASAQLSGSGSSTGGSDEEVDEEEVLARLGLLSYPSGVDSPASIVPRRRQRAAPAGAKASPELASLASIWASSSTAGLGSKQASAQRSSSALSSDGSTSAGARSGSMGGSYSLWKESSSSASFYEQLQAAASDSIFAPPAISATSALLVQALPQPLHSGAAPFPGLARPAAPPAAARALGFLPGVAVGLPVSGFAAPLAAGEVYGHPLSGAPAAVDAERDMAQLLAAVASMATLE